MERFEQKLKYGTHRIRQTLCENPKDDVISYKWSKDPTAGEKVIVQGRNAIIKFKDWLNNLDI